MKKLSLLLLISFLFLSVASFAQSKRLNVMSYNIRNGKGMDEVTNIDRIAVAINQVSPDIVGMQEVDSMTTRNNYDVLKTLSEKSNMPYYVFSPSIDYQSGKYGHGLMSREKPVNSYHKPLPGTEEARSLLVVEFDTYVVLNTHLSLTPDDQEASCVVIKAEAAKFPCKTVLLMGDLNVQPEDEVIKMLKVNFTIISNAPAFTFPADNPLQCIDYIMVAPHGKEVTSQFSYVYNDPIASDHRPLVVGVEIK